MAGGLGTRFPCPWPVGLCGQLPAGWRRPWAGCRPVRTCGGCVPQAATRQPAPISEALQCSGRIFLLLLVFFLKVLISQGNVQPNACRKGWPGCLGMCQPFHFRMVTPHPCQGAAPCPLLLVEPGGPGGRSRKWPNFPSQGPDMLMQLKRLLNWSTSQSPDPWGLWLEAPSTFRFKGNRISPSSLYEHFFGWEGDNAPL